ncbi:helix-turn-helix domain-containing protein [Rubidibacter lacunae]|nr:hypothetical protein [Rubidibacter lacunae]
MARQYLKPIQSLLADRLGKSLSWIRDIESGRFGASSEDLAQLR